MMKQGVLNVRNSDGDLNNQPFNIQTRLDHLNIRLVCYSDSHCIAIQTDCIILKLVSITVGSDYGTSLVFKWSKEVRSLNGLLFEW